MTEGPSYNLLDVGWLPCRDTNGRLTYLGIREALARAPDLRELADASPLVTAALHRLLLAVLHRVVSGPTDGQAWLRLWKAGAWDETALDAYLETVRPQFDLFGAEQPFYQVASLDQAYAGPASKLALDLASGNNATLFDHTLDAEWVPLDASAAARALVTYQAFAPPGLLSFEKGQNQHRSGKGGPLARGAMVLLRGDNLFQTLQLNLTQYDPPNHHPTSTTTGDRPAWEAEDVVLPDDRSSLGLLDYLTWQSRRIRLFPDQALNGRLVVRKVVIMKGAQLRAGVYPADQEPMLGYRVRQKPKPNEDPFLTVGFSEERVFWRDSQALVDRLSTANGASRPPWTVRWLGEVSEQTGEAINPGRELPGLDLLGITGDKAKPLFWRRERLPLPLAYLSERGLLEALQSAITMAELGGRALDLAVRQLASLALAPDQNQGGRSADPNQVGALKAHLDAGRSYWSALEAPFKQVMSDLPGDRMERDGVTVYGNEKLAEWEQRVVKTARRALQAATEGFDETGRTLKASVAAERALNGMLRRERLGASNQQ